VTGVFLLKRELKANAAVAFIAAQCAGALAGMLVAHLMFEEPLFQLSTKMRSGVSQWSSEWVATFGLVLSILLTLRAKPSAIPAVVGLYITAAYWFTASTSFANPAMTLARSLSDTFAGIQLADVPPFVIAQLAGAASAFYVCEILTGSAEKPNRPKSLARGSRT
jgi:glycerol uptake facilitator-like aquaporin